MKRVLDEDKDRDVIEGWKKQAEGVQSLDEAFAFTKGLLENFEHDYGTIVHAIGSAMIATLNGINRSEQGGITGFQAGCLMHMLIPQLSGIQAPYRILDFNNLLYPQYEQMFAKTIDEDTWNTLKHKAEQKIREYEGSSDVIDHWKSVASGNVPFGYSIAPNW